ncbi:tRNA epoxyqueuosine(34) reductase QueG [Silvanigrella aquatica]|uniref:tRNA epoxyqueuosine(34) reductase QueG n=1 Tax=Silvanigrella aquatica TaxID=1915309 RepID=A0A1L4D3V4_9BACT|nr:tRNA epoxyqueuosine(34) reductase QueG [Silvanigrella aquatica]APJ04896.1 tRNA epoxyqueuosine(34) reductase QueG [Silvanigrella aquatica]
MKLKKEILDLLNQNGILSAGVFSFEKNHSLILEKDIPAFQKWLSENAHAKMTFLENNIEARKDPSLILPNVKNALIFLFPYAAGHRVRNKKKENAHNNIQLNHNSESILAKKLISKYVYGKDYHKVLKKQLNLIATKLQKQIGNPFQFRAVVDSIPFFDRAYAREAALGFIGKNTMLIRPGMGSFFFIATLLTDASIQDICDLNLENKNAILNLDCGDCTKCLDACPTQAFKKPYFLDANRCLSYLSIEHRDIVDNEFIPHFANTIYGCDICQEVCPYNLVTSDFKILKEFSNYHNPFQIITAKDMALMDTDQYEKWFGGTAATRAKYQGLVRNALYHLHSVSDSSLPAILDKLCASEYELILKTVMQLRVLQKA